MSNETKTAVEWLVKELNQKIDFIPLEKWDMIRDIIQQAKEMEKKQIEDAELRGKEIIIIKHTEVTNEQRGKNNKRRKVKSN